MRQKEREREKEREKEEETSRQYTYLRVKGEADDLRRVADVRVLVVSRFRVPQFARLVERSGDN